MMFGGGFGEAGAEVVVEEFMAGRGSLVLRAVRRRARAAARHRAGPQARLRRRPGAEHRRHGRLFAGAGDDRRDLRARDGRDRSIRRCARMKAMGAPYKGVLYAGLMIDEGWPEADRIQCPLRRSGMPGADAADDVGHRAGADRRRRRAVEEFRPALVSTTPALTVVMATKGYPGDYGKGSRHRRPRRGRQGRGRRDLPCRHQGATDGKISPMAAAC